MKTNTTTTTTNIQRLLSAHHDESAARLKKLQDRLTTLRAENNTTPLVGDAFLEVDLGEVPLKLEKKPTRAARIIAWLDSIEDRPIICGLIAAAIGIIGGWIFGYNI